MLRRRRALFVLFVAILCAVGGASAGCAGSRTEFETKYAPNARREGMTVSVFGVYKDGRMSADSWAELAPRFAAALGGQPCDPLQTDGLVLNDRDVTSALDDATRSDGVSDELLDVFAPAASGDAIMLVTISGRPPAEPPLMISPGSQPATFSQRGKAGRSIAGSGRTDPAAISGGPGVSRGAHDVFAVSATLFSVRDHQTVGVVAMSYTGKSVDEAMAAFFTRLRAELPGMQCRGWKPDVHVDADRVRTARPSD